MALRLSEGLGRTAERVVDDTDRQFVLATTGAGPVRGNLDPFAGVLAGRSQRVLQRKLTHEYGRWRRRIQLDSG